MPQVIYKLDTSYTASFCLSSSYLSLIFVLLGVSDVGECSVGQLVEEANAPGAFVHEVVQGEAGAHALGPVEPWNRGSSE